MMFSAHYYWFDLLIYNCSKLLFFTSSVVLLINCIGAKGADNDDGMQDLEDSDYETSYDRRKNRRERNSQSSAAEFDFNPALSPVWRGRRVVSGSDTSTPITLTKEEKSKKSKKYKKKALLPTQMTPVSNNEISAGPQKSEGKGSDSKAVVEPAEKVPNEPTSTVVAQLCEVPKKEVNGDAQNADGQVKNGSVTKDVLESVNVNVAVVKSSKSKKLPLKTKKAKEAAEGKEAAVKKEQAPAAAPDANNDELIKEVREMMENDKIRNENSKKRNLKARNAAKDLAGKDAAAKEAAAKETLNKWKLFGKK